MNRELKFKAEVFEEFFKKRNMFDMEIQGLYDEVAEAAQSIYDEHQKTSDELREDLASLCHEQWMGWMKYMFSKCEPQSSYPNPLNPDGKECLVIPAWAVERWRKQMNMPYCELSVEEQESDRKEADLFIAMMRAM